MKKLLFIPLLAVCFMVSSQNPSTVIGKPIRIGKILVAQNDFPKIMSWVDAIAACENLGKGWRLPNKEELNILFLNKDKIGGFETVASNYWSSTGDEERAWMQKITSGKQFYFLKYEQFHVRAIRTP
jgi:hypothetical protein